MPIIGAANTISNEINTVISADTEHPAEICRIIDYFFTTEGSRASTSAEWYVENYEEIGSKWYHDKDNPWINVNKVDTKKQSLERHNSTKLARR